MKKKISILLGLIVFAGIVYMGNKYYNARYVASNVYYFKVPQDQSTAIEDLYDRDGNAVDRGRAYKFEAYDDHGESRIVEFEFMTEDSKKLLQPLEYVKVETSDQIVLSQKRIKLEEVPEKALEKINLSNQ